MGVNSWVVVVEENVDHLNHRRWDISKYFAAEDYERALYLAHQTAMYHKPVNPKSPRSRTLLRTPDGSWLVHVKGATTECHFRVTVAEHYGEHPGETQA